MMLEEERSDVLSRPRYGRGTPKDDGEPSAVVGVRHGHRERTLTGTFGKTRIAVPRARLMGADGRPSPKSRPIRSLTSPPDRLASCRPKARQQIPTQVATGPSNAAVTLLPSMGNEKSGIASSAVAAVAGAKRAKDELSNRILRDYRRLSHGR
jgi:hypothetical protein